jgi:hypothetical protein
MRFELKLSTGQVVEWEGSDGVNAAERYVDAHRDAVVIAWREANRHGIFPMGNARNVVG